MTGPRSTREVFDDHLALAEHGDVETDLERNYDPDVVMLWRDGVEHGHEGARRLARVLEQELPGAAFTYTNRLVAGDVAFLEWTAEAEGGRVRDGADSFVVRNGLVVAQTIHYTVEPSVPPPHGCTCHPSTPASPRGGSRALRPS